MRALRTLRIADTDMTRLTLGDGVEQIENLELRNNRLEHIVGTERLNNLRSLILSNDSVGRRMAHWPTLSERVQLRTLEAADIPGQWLPHRADGTAYDWSELGTYRRYYAIPRRSASEPAPALPALPAVTELDLRNNDLGALPQTLESLYPRLRRGTFNNCHLTSAHIGRRPTPDQVAEPG